MKRGVEKQRPKWIWALLGLGLLLGVNFFYSDTFFQLEIRNGHVYGTLVDILHQGSKVMILALGMTLVIAAGGVDLSVGSVMAIAGAVAATLTGTMNLPLGLGLGAGLMAGALAGIGNGLLVGWVGVQPIIATLILMVAGRGIAMLLTNGQIVTFENPAFVFLANGHFLGLPFTLFIVAILVGMTAWLTRRTAMGLFVESVGDNPVASWFCGVNTARVKISVYVFSALCASVAGFIATSNIKAADSSRVGEMMELDAIFAVIVGGTALTGGRFTLAGSMIGALLIQTLTTTLYNFGVSPSVAPVPKAIVIVGVCLLQSERFRNDLNRAWSRLRAGAGGGVG